MINQNASDDIIAVGRYRLMYLYQDYTASLKWQTESCRAP